MVGVINQAYASIPVKIDHLLTTYTAPDLPIRWMLSNLQRQRHRRAPLPLINKEVFLDPL